MFGKALFKPRKVLEKMKFTVIKFVVLSLLLLSSITVKATIIDTSDEYSTSGSSSNSVIAWLLVSDTETSAPEPGSISLIVLGLLGIALARRQQKQA